MSNPGLDAANVESDNVKTEKRQAEIEALVNAILEFKPTKIAIESSYGNTKMQERYTSYIKNPDPLTVPPDEIYQLAFRIAQKMGHKSIYPIDHQLNISPSSMDSLMMKDPSKAQYIQGAIGTIQDSLNYWTENILMKKTIGDFLVFMNTNKMIEGNYALYLDFLKELYGEDNYAGAEMLSLWHQRNLMIFQNLTRIADFDNSDERILILFGQGHSKILRDLVQDANYFDYVDVLDYIK